MPDLPDHNGTIIDVGDTVTLTCVVTNKEVGYTNKLRLQAVYDVPSTDGGKTTLDAYSGQVEVVAP